FRKVRPVVVVTPTAEIVAERSLRVLAITTRLPSPLPDDHVLLPWDRQESPFGFAAPMCSRQQLDGGNPSQRCATNRWHLAADRAQSAPGKGKRFPVGAGTDSGWSSPRPIRGASAT